ncbi:MAG TPA: hypothetical protein VNT52_00950 [Acidimicrobiales bacterium]|nr:hypothetical protein [Acidimicrobiales bacterium]
MSAIQFEHKGAQYRADRIDAMKQFHIVRRLAPVLAEVAAVAKADAADEGAVVAVVGAVGNALAGLSDADADFVLHGLLAAVSFQRDGEGWHRVSVGGAIMRADLPLPDLLFLAFKSAQANFADFFAAVPSSLKAAALKASAP